MATARELLDNGTWKPPVHVGKGLQSQVTGQALCGRTIMRERVTDYGWDGIAGREVCEECYALCSEGLRQRLMEQNP